MKNMKDKEYILEINIDDKNLPIPTPEIKHERDLAIYDLLQENYFKIYR